MESTLTYYASFPLGIIGLITGLLISFAFNFYKILLDDDDDDDYNIKYIIIVSVVLGIFFFLIDLLTPPFLRIIYPLILLLIFGIFIYSLMNK